MSGSACGKKKGKSIDLVTDFTDKKPHGEISWKIILEKVALWMNIQHTSFRALTYGFSCIENWMDQVVHIKSIQHICELEQYL